jgi:hypothetical protein
MRISIALDCADPDRLAEFWAAALHYKNIASLDQYRVLVPESGDGPVFILQQVDEPRAGKNRMHIDLHGGSVESEVERLLALGATTTGEIIELGDTGIRWQVMHDPEGNEFCAAWSPGD